MLEEIQSLGAHLIAISPQVTKESRVTAEKSGLTFHLLSDLGNKVARSFGLVFQLPPDLREIYLRLGIDLSVSNGDDSFELPIPATYVIDRGGVIRAVRADADYVKRMEPSDIVTALESITADVA